MKSAGISEEIPALFIRPRGQLDNASLGEGSVRAVLLDVAETLH